MAKKTTKTMTIIATKSVTMDVSEMKKMLLDKLNEAKKEINPMIKKTSKKDFKYFIEDMKREIILNYNLH